MPEALATLVEAMPERLRVMVLLSAWCGLRFGEVTELRRCDVRGGTVQHVERAVVRVEGGHLVGLPKSEAGVRTVAMPPALVPVVAEHLDRFVAPDPDALLFPAHHGGHLAPSTVYRHLHAAREVAGLPTLRWHDLRHHAATTAARHGATLAQLQRRLGHSTVAAAMRYQHAAQQEDEALAARMG